MADDDRESSPGRIALDGERGGEGESQESIGSDVLRMMKESGLDMPTSFFNTLENVEVNEKELAHIFTERVYYATNGATEKYEIYFPISMRLVWNDEKEDEKKYINDIHDDYVASFKKKNAR